MYKAILIQVNWIKTQEASPCTIKYRYLHTSCIFSVQTQNIPHKFMQNITRNWEKKVPFKQVILRRQHMHPYRAIKYSLQSFFYIIFSMFSPKIRL